jgi:prolyl-tRNA editing enzyme YbaK/EbsC (Cys-tRNA(Pro) deacylase)
MSVKNFKDYLNSNNLEIQVIESDQPTHTAEQAAQVHAVPVSNIVKSLLVVCENTSLEGDEKSFFMILVPGNLRLDLEKWSKKLCKSLGGRLKMASPDDVKEITGYSIGGVPPFGHKTPIETYIDEGFNRSQELVAAAGSANAVFRISYDGLKEQI